MDIKDLKILDLVKVQHEGDNIKYEGYVIAINDESVRCVWPEVSMWGDVYKEDTIFELFRGHSALSKTEPFNKKIKDVKNLWSCLYKKQETLELTLDDIADKYGVDVSTIKIKK